LTSPLPSHPSQAPKITGDFESRGCPSSSLLPPCCWFTCGIQVRVQA
jgi:hypothetical protein